MESLRHVQESVRTIIEAFILDPKNHDILALIKAIRNGLVYGTKIRFPHALVMTVLFREGSIRTKALAVYRATRQHALNLALFACSYKTLLYLLRNAPSLLHPTRKPGHESPIDAFIAGLASGYIVFGRRAANRGAQASGVNQQIVIYVFARVVLGFAKLAIAPSGPVRVGERGIGAYGDVRTGGGGWLDGLAGGGAWKRRVERDSWAVFASLSWGAVMWLFRWHPDVLQPSLRSSMKYLYDNAESWDGIRNFVWHNQ